MGVWGALQDGEIRSQARGHHGVDCLEARAGSATAIHSLSEVQLRLGRSDVRAEQDGASSAVRMLAGMGRKGKEWRF